MASINIEADVDVWVRKVRKTIGESFGKKVLRKGARVAAREMKRQIINSAQYKDITQPSRNPNKRYKDGKVVATYPIGNLSASVGTFTFKNSPDYFAGPRSGKYKGGRRSSALKADGYYGNIFNNGSKHFKGVHFIEKTKEKSENAVKQKIKTEALKELGLDKKKNGIA